jgi:methanogenic corrinoid protein MtbC1
VRIAVENQTLSKKPLFNLSIVLQETGLKADTLRAWERRYQLPSPSRTAGGHRLFSAYDIETIKWLQARQNEGMRISQAVDYWQELIAAGLDPLEEEPRESQGYKGSPFSDSMLQPLDSLRRQWIESALSFDQDQALKFLEGAFAQFPWEMVGEDLIFSGLSEIGKRWYDGEITVQQEHFASELVLRILASLINEAPSPFHPQRVVMGSPPGEFHTIALSLTNLLLRYRGWDVTYLGADVPVAQLEESLQAINPDLVIMTAARLKTAATLLDAGRFLSTHQVPLAFSGNIFTQVPALSERIPGQYLGAGLSAAMTLIEKMLSEPEPPLIPRESSNPFEPLAETFSSQLSMLENAAFQITLEEYNLVIPITLIQDANHFFFQDMIAALKLGDINFLTPNINWVKGLLLSRNYPQEIFFTYLSSFTRICEQNLGSQAEPILTWLTKMRSS